jgi:hypothetical protein
MKFPRIFDAQVVRVPAVHMLSLIAIGIPSTVDAVPALRSLSALSACDSAASPVTVMNALTLSSTALILFRTDPVIARDVVSPFSSMSRSSWIVREKRSMVTPLSCSGRPP